LFFEQPTDPNKLDYLKRKSPLTLVEMENDWTLTHKEWAVVKEVKLSRRQKVCFYLFYWKAIRQEEIAIRLGITRSSVATHIQRAREKCRHYLLSRKQVSGSGTSQTP